MSSPSRQNPATLSAIRVASLIAPFYTTDLSPRLPPRYLRTRTPWTARRMWPTDPPNCLQNPDWSQRTPRTHPSTANATARTTSARTPRPSTVAASPPCSAPSNCNAACTNRSRTLATTTNHPLLLWNVIWASSRATPLPPWPNASVGWLPSRPNRKCWSGCTREHHVRWSVGVLRNVTAAVSGGIAAHLQAVQRQTLLDWLEQARQSKGRGRVVLAVGRDGLMLPIRQESLLQGRRCCHPERLRPSRSASGHAVSGGDAPAHAGDAQCGSNGVVCVTC